MAPGRAAVPGGRANGGSIQSGTGQAMPGRPGRVETGRVETGRPGRPPPRYPGRGNGWGPAAAGIGAGIIGGILIDQAMRRPIYEYEPEPPPPRHPRGPIVTYDDEDEILRSPRRPARQAAPPRRTPPANQTARPAPRQPRVIVPPVAEQRYVADEILFELAPGAQAETVLRRHRATLISSRRFELAGVTIIRARLNDGRNARVVLAQMAGDRAVASAQPNYVYSLQQEAGKAQAGDVQTIEVSEPETPKAAEAQPDAAKAEAPGAEAAPEVPRLEEPNAAPQAVVAEPATPTPKAEELVAPVLAAPAAAAPAPAAKREMQPQYIVEKLHLDAIHKLARGERIKVAVVDSGIDQAHPELQGVVTGSFDALGGEVIPDAHGTAMSAAILAQAQLQGVAPAARLLAARAFSGSDTPGAANGTTFHILTALDWASEQGARVLNLSFAGPQDRLLSRSLAGAKGKGIVAVAAAGNGGEKAAPLYPGADPSVIAVTATDADDKPFTQANRGSYIAVAAPGVDVLAAEPQGRYAFSSGTSIAAAHVSGLVALILEKRPDLDAEGVRKLLMESAVDLGAKGRDPIFGAGRVDAPAALARALPVTAARP